MIIELFVSQNIKFFEFFFILSDTFLIRGTTINTSKVINVMITLKSLPDKVIFIPLNYLVFQIIIYLLFALILKNGLINILYCWNIFYGNFAVRKNIPLIKYLTGPFPSREPCLR